MARALLAGLSIIALLGVSVAPAERLPVRLYNTADGLARDSLHCILNGSDGFLWFCTGEGISRYDGYAFRTWRTLDGLPDRDVRAMIPDREGGFWVGTGNGVTRFSPNALNPENRFLRVPIPGDLKSASIRSLLRDTGGTVWAGADGGLYRLPARNGTNARSAEPIDLTQRPNGQQPKVFALLEGRSNRIWIGASSGLFLRLSDGRLLRFSEGDGLPGTFITSLLEDPEGRIWIGTSTGLVAAHFDPGSGRLIVERTWSARDRLPDASIRSLFRAASGSLWVGTQHGIAELSGASPTAEFRAYLPANGLPDGNVEGFAEDSTGGLWVVTDGAGAARIAPDGFVSYDGSDGLAFPRTASIGLDRSQRVFVVTGAPGQLAINRFDGHRFVPQELAVSPGFFPPTWSAWHQVGIQSAAGDWWMASDRGLIRFAASALSPANGIPPLQILRVAEGLPSNEVVHVFEDSKGNIWLSTWPELADPAAGQRTGVAVLLKASGTIQRFSEQDGLPPLTSFKADWFHEDRYGQIWIGLYRIGLVRFRQGRFRFFGAADGVPEGGIRAMYEDGEGHLWLASGRGGLGVIENPLAEQLRITRYGTADGLSSDEIQAITADKWGRIYAGTGLGVDRLELPLKGVRHYTASDGLAPGEVTDAVRDSMGDLWIGTVKGVSRFTPRQDRPKTSLPVRIFGIRIAGASQPLSDSGVTSFALPDFRPGQNDLQVDFAAVGASPATLPLYQYRLEGAGGEWSPPNEQRSVIFSSLRPGRYRFLVRSNGGGYLTSPPASLEFRVLPHFWERWWFLPGCGLVLAGLAWGAYQYRVANLKEIERMRTRIARDLHDDVGSALSKIVILIEVAERSGSTAQATGALLTRIAETSREVLDSVGDLVWAINARTEHFEDLIRRMRAFSTQVFEAKDVNFRFDAATIPARKQVSPETLRHVYLIFKEAVNNAARHSRCTEASATFRIEGERLILMVADNGTGFSTVRGSDHHGIESLKARALALKGEIDWTTDSGTTVTLWFPAPK